MSMKIKISYTDDEEERMILSLLKPLSGRYKVKKTTGTPPFKRIYFIPTKAEKSQN